MCDTMCAGIAPRNRGVRVGGGCVPSILMCYTMCAGIVPRNTSIDHIADLCKLHWVILNVVSLNSVNSEQNGTSIIFVSLLVTE